MKLSHFLRSLLLWTYGIDQGRSNSPAKKPNQVHPAVEIMEDRHLMASSLAALSSLAVVPKPVVEVVTVKQPAVSVLANQSFSTSFQNGIASEYMIALASQLNADPWFNMP